MTLRPIERGELVMSIAGHDAGTVLVALEVQGDHLLLANGAERKLSAPKRKKIKHIKRLNVKIDLDGFCGAPTDGALRNAVGQKLKEIGGF